MAEPEIAPMPKPHVQRFVEALAAVLDLDHGHHERLELIFDEGRLVQWRTYEERRSVAELAQYDEVAAWLVERRAA